MAHLFEYDDKIKVTKLVYLSEITLDQRISIVTELCELIRRNGSQKILIDAQRLETSMSPVEQEIWGNFVCNLEEIKTAWVAVVYKESREINTTSIEQSIKAGHKVKKFYHCDEAKDWLVAQS